MMTGNRGITVEARELLLLVKELVHTGTTSLITADTLLAKLVGLEGTPSSPPSAEALNPRNRPKRQPDSNGHDDSDLSMGRGSLLPSPIDPQKSYDLTTAAQFLGRSKVTIRRLVTAGKLNADRDGDGSRAPFRVKGSELIKQAQLNTPGDDES